MKEKGPFFAVPRTTLETSEGPAEFPILYYDTSVVVALFMVDRDAADAEVRDQGLRLAMTRGGSSVAFIAGYDYRVTSIGPYFEVGIAIPVVPADAPSGNRWPQVLRDVDSKGRDLGYHVLHLPVSTAAANAAGREVWGLPKFVTSMDVRHSGRDVLVRVDDPTGGEPIMELSGRAGIGVPAPSLPIVLYSELHDAMLRTTVNVRGGNALRAGGGVALRIGDGQHPMAQTLRRLGMDGARPLSLLTTHDFQSRLNLGSPVGAVAESASRSGQVTS